MANGILEVLLVDAGELRENNCWCCCINCLIPCLNETNPFVLIQYGSQEQISGVAQGEGNKEIWNEKFKFNVEFQDHEEDHHSNNKLILRIMDKHRFTSDNLVGQTTIYIKDVLQVGMDEGEVEYGPRIYRVVRSDKRYSGEISVSISFTKTNDEKSKQDFRSWKHNDET